MVAEGGRNHHAQAGVRPREHTWPDVAISAQILSPSVRSGSMAGPAVTHRSDLTHTNPV